MYDQVYRYLDLPGQVCENTAIISKTLCVISATAARCSLSLQPCVCVCVCVLKVSHAEVWEAGSAVCQWNRVNI